MAKKIDILTETRDFGGVCTFALRYAMGRRTYAPSMVIGFVLRNIDKLDIVDLKVMLKDIEEYDRMYKGDFGDECDKRDWLLFKQKLTAEIANKESK